MDEIGMQNPIFKLMHAFNGMGNNSGEDNINPNSIGMNNQMDMNNMNQMMNNQMEMNNHMNMNMNNMIQMLNNQMDMNNLNLMNQYNNQMNLNNDINKIKDNDPMNLMRQINQIIQMNPILTNQDKEIIFQLYQLYQNINRVNQIFGVSKFKDEYPEIKEPKNNIYLIRNDDGKRFGILIPYSLKIDELYPIAEKYKLHKYSDLKLFYKNKYLREDETPIFHISFGDEINIVEELNDIDFTYYQSYLSKNNKKYMVYIIFIFPSGNKKSMNFTLETTVKEMIKMFFFENRIPEKEKKNFMLLYNGKKLDFNDNSTLLEKGITMNCTNIFVEQKHQFNEGISCHGKKIRLKIYNKEKLIFNIMIGTLNTIETLYIFLEETLSANNKKIQKLEIGGHELKKNDKRTFSSIGIRNDFICNIEFIK